MPPIIALSDNHDNQWYIHEEHGRLVLKIAQLVLNRWYTCSFEMNKPAYERGIEELIEGSACRIPLENGELAMSFNGLTSLEVCCAGKCLSAQSSLPPAEFRPDNKYRRHLAFMAEWETIYL